MDRLLQAGLRKNLGSFIRKVFATVSPGTRYIPNWHIDAMVHQLMRVHTGQSRRLLVSQPPRSLKSICVRSIMWRGAWAAYQSELITMWNCR
jgi:hypothetical protein